MNKTLVYVLDSCSVLDTCTCSSYHHYLSRLGTDFVAGAIKSRKPGSDPVDGKLLGFFFFYSHGFNSIAKGNHNTANSCTDWNSHL